MAKELSNKKPIKPLLKLKALRVEYQLAQDDVSKELGVSKNYYEKKENGVGVFTLEECWAILKILKQTSCDIFINSSK